MTDKIDVVFTEDEIDKRIAELGAQITRDYKGKEITMSSCISLYTPSKSQMSILTKR